ncbi:MAG: hypothetical protein A2Y80_01135 [Deltaproteobacteria bacterium RBG_13_58_19]|nr:MAG: hypothetical protein A2Y80_01135 [Deltaproteobacteria bacterium RBG_13_58_19]
MEKTLRILVVDDNPDDRVLIKRELSREFPRVQVTEVTNAQAHTLALAGAPQDLAITDYQLGWSNGLAILQEIKARWPECPVIMFTGTGNEEVAVEAMKHGLEDYVLKTHRHYIRLVASVKKALKRKKERLALLAAEDRYSRLFNNAPIGLYRISSQGEIVEANPALVHLLGFSDRKTLLAAKSVDFYVDLGDKQRWRDQMQHLGEVRGFELQIRKRDGSAVWARNNARAIRDKGGEILGYEGSLEDVTPYRQAMEAFQVLVNSAPMGIYIVQDGKFKRVNPGFAKICGYSEEELIGRPSLNLVAPDYWEEVRHNAVRMLQGQSHLPYEFPVITKSGKTKWVVEKVAPTVYQGERAALGYFLDISEHKSLESQFLQAQKMEAVGRLAGGVAHDFNNMLGVIIGHAEIAMMQVSVTEPLHHNLQEIHIAAQRSADLTRQLLAFARQQTVRPQVLNLNLVLSGMLKMLQRLIGEDIDLVWAPGRDLWKVKIDPSQIDQILANLAVNARDAIGGVGKLTIGTNNAVLDDPYCTDHAEFVPGEYVLLAVSDDGSGMDKETLAQIFEPFFTTKGVGEGTGLGLATVYGIVKQNDGFINVYSEPGHGTTFRIYLPRCQAEAAQDQAETPVKSLQGGSETVLMVEDEKAILDIGLAILKQLGYTVLTAGTPGEAIRLAGNYPGDIHLLISDVVMPEMNGRELAERLIAMKPGLKCLYMSGYTTNVIAHRGVLDEGVHFIQKPFSMKDLAIKAREVLEG